MANSGMFSANLRPSSSGSPKNTMSRDAARLVERKDTLNDLRDYIVNNSLRVDYHLLKKSGIVLAELEKLYERGVRDGNIVPEYRDSDARFNLMSEADDIVLEFKKPDCPSDAFATAASLAGSVGGRARHCLVPRRGRGWRRHR
jgi:hypothetical protein